MDRFIGVKEINATPMNRGDYNALRGWVVPSGENPEDDGFLVEYVDGGTANHPDFSGYRLVTEGCFRAGIPSNTRNDVRPCRRGNEAGLQGRPIWLGMEWNVRLYRSRGQLSGANGRRQEAFWRRLAGSVPLISGSQDGAGRCCNMGSKLQRCPVRRLQVVQ